ncbi:hypothetical protein [Secundilactobacillus similis]|uniref:hypothetical protein n=1 Tax=Secundilactobacillus similis TaxID=414682 RepID=UPI0006D136F9|nr:hypothetical protein [Secundilactobacillus similis]
MTKAEILAKFAAGFEVGDKPYQDNLVVDDINTTDDELRLWAYDANFFQLILPSGKNNINGRLLSKFYVAAEFKKVIWLFLSTVFRLESVI